MISPLAYIHPEAKIGENVEIAPFVFIDKNVVIGDNNKIMANANGSRIGNGNTIFPGAVIGAIPQDLKFRGEESTAEIGDNNLIRENVTINRGTACPCLSAPARRTKKCWPCCASASWMAILTPSTAPRQPRQFCWRRL